MRVLAGLYVAVLLLALWDDKEGKAKAQNTGNPPPLKSSGNAKNRGPKPPLVSASSNEPVFPLTLAQARKSDCKIKAVTVSFQPEGCDKQDLTMNMCYGTCSSFYIPSVAGTLQKYFCCAPTTFVTSSLSFTCGQNGGAAIVARVVSGCGCRFCKLVEKI